MHEALKIQGISPPLVRNAANEGLLGSKYELGSLLHRNEPMGPVTRGIIDARVFRAAVKYAGRAGSANWEGRVADDQQVFGRYLRELVRPWLIESSSDSKPGLKKFASSRIATEFVERLLNAMPLPAPWEVGEALAASVLAEDPTKGIRWPWNTARDRRSLRASLPGPDLIGLCLENDTALLLFGEVKTSSDPSTPPSVMHGRRGMTAQVERIVSCPDVQLALLSWLLARCRNSPDRDLYEQAIERYLDSEGKDVLLVGALLRDTEPNELDLKGPAERLSKRIDPTTRVDLIAIYLPAPIHEWPHLL